LSEQKRYQVFISSTYFDLKEERQAVVTTLLELEALPSGMELFPASDDDAWSLIESIIDDCDYYLLVIGGRYGSIDPVEEISYTEKEFDYAVKVGKPVMAFLHGDEGSIPARKGEESEAGRAKLAAFRGKVRNAKHVRFWTSELELARQVSTTYLRFVRNYPAVGWVRADKQTSAESLAEINALRKRVAELEGRLEEVRTSPPPGAEELAQGAEPFKILVRTEAATFPPKGARTSISAWRKVEVPWDGLFRTVGPSLLDECEQDRLKEILSDALYEAFVEDAFVPALKDRAVQLWGDQMKEAKFYEGAAEVDEDDFGTVLVQLIALGLIEKSRRQRSVSDRGIYWSLTPYGNQHLVQLRAIRRAEASTE
jgi:hypothetical protein